MKCLCVTDRPVLRSVQQYISEGHCHGYKDGGQAVGTGAADHDRQCWIVQETDVESRETHYDER